MAYVRILRTSVTQKFAFYLLLECVLRIFGVVVPLLQDRFKILRQAECKLLVLARSWVLEAEQSCVEGVARHCFKTVLDKLLILREGRSLQYLVATVALIVKERVADILHMNTNLMSSSRFEAALHQGHISVAFQHLVVCNGVLTLRTISKDIHLVAVLRVATDMARDCTLVISQVAPHKGDIATLCGVVEELF